MLKWLLDKFRRKPRPSMQIPISPDQVMADDPFARDVIARTFNAPPGHYVIGRVDDDGKLHIEEKEMKNVP